MASGGCNGPPLGSISEAQMISAGGVEDVEALGDVFRELSSRAVTDLLSLGACVRCILRLLGVQGHIFLSPFLSTSVLCSVIGKLTSLDRNIVDGCFETNEDSTNAQISSESVVEPAYCCICLGILQFTYCDEKGILVKKECANELVTSIAELVKQEDHQMDNFSLEVSLPPIVVENEEIIWSYMRRKYGSEIWFQEKILRGRLSAKDALKFSITSSLENLLGVNSGPGSLRIRFTCPHPKGSMKVTNSSDSSQDCKRRKTGSTGVLKSVSKSTGVKAESSPLSNSGVDQVSKISAIESQDNEFTEHLQLLPKMVNQACQMTYLCCRTPVYIGGRYLKYSRNVSQTRWVIDDERMGEASVEEIIGSRILSTCRGDDYKFQAAGREDIDVRMLGSGRPFLLEIQNARFLPSEVHIKEMERKINNLETKLVKVKNLRVLGSESRTLMQEGEAEKQKQYAAVVWISRPLKDEDLQTISTFKDMEILQRTPVRVLHRRSPLEREKIIHWMKVERITGSSQYFLLHLCTQAGTYIKEFVHGDLGRCHPSIGSILGCRAEILQLDVTDVKMDCFL